MIRPHLIANRLKDRLPVFSELIVRAQSMYPPAVAVEDPDVLDVGLAEVRLMPADPACHKRELVFVDVFLSALLDKLPATGNSLLTVEEGGGD